MLMHTNKVSVCFSASCKRSADYLLGPRLGTKIGMHGLKERLGHMGETRLANLGGQCCSEVSFWRFMRFMGGTAVN